MEIKPSGKKVLVVFLILFFSGGSFVIGNYWGYEKKAKAEAIARLIGETGYQVPDIDFSLLLKAWNLIDEKYVFPDKPSDEERLYGAISGLVESIGDPYSIFLPPKEAEIFQGDIQGNFGGVGIEIGMRDGVLTVISPLKDTPAFQAGIKSGDKIVKIDGVTTFGLSIDEAVLKIRGEKGTKVTLSFFRDAEKIDQDGETFEKTLIRTTINIPTIESEQIGTVFVIRLFNFTAHSSELFENALREFVRSTADKLVIDLRGNPGGFLESAVEIASFFLPGGEVVVTEDTGEGDDDIIHRSKGFNFFEKLPKIVVLVDGGTASASEILAAALQDNKLATIVGEKTFGKGSVQELINLTNDTFVKLTVAKWLTPGGKSLSLEGITPDILVKIKSEDVSKGYDPQLEKALLILGK